MSQSDKALYISSTELHSVYASMSVLYIMYSDIR